MISPNFSALESALHLESVTQKNNTLRITTIQRLFLTSMSWNLTYLPVIWCFTL